MSGKTTRISALGIGVTLAVVAAGAFLIQPHREPALPTIAFVPQSAGSLLWEVEHFGAIAAAERVKCHLYWNAPTAENDVAGQISLIDKVGRGKYQGLVLAPNHPLSIIAPLRRAIANGLPVIIIADSLDLPVNGKVGYIVNDDNLMGEMAAAEVARLIHGEGSIAVLGMTRYVPGVTARARGAERFLAEHFPNIHVVERLAGSYNPVRAEELVGIALDSHPGLKALLSLTAGSTRGAHTALKNRSLQHAIRLVGCEQDSDLIGYVGSGEISAILAENTYRMGYEAVGLISEALAGKSLPPRIVIPPVLIGSQNVNSAAASLFAGLPR